MMKVKRLIVSLCCFVLALFSTGTYAEKIPVNKNWEDTTWCAFFVFISYLTERRKYTSHPVW